MEQRRPPTSDRIHVSVGHWTNHSDLTGCTVVLFDQAAPCVVDVRGGAPGTRETSLFGSGDLVQSVDAILLTGGSAFGLEAAGGVMDHLRELGRGVHTKAGPVPIVPTAVLYDLAIGSPVWPTAASARSACQNAVPVEHAERGQIGVGVGTSTRKIFPDIAPERGGFGIDRVLLSDGSAVHALVAVNAAGEVVRAPDSSDNRWSLLAEHQDEDSRSSTTLAVVVIQAPVDRRTLARCAVAAHDAFARSIRPCHTIYDGDVVFVVGLADGAVPTQRIIAFSTAAELSVERAIIDAVSRRATNP